MKSSGLKASFYPTSCEVPLELAQRIQDKNDFKLILAIHDRGGIDFNEQHQHEGCSKRPRTSTGMFKENSVALRKSLNIT